MLQRQVTAKRAWARMSERAELGERFGFIACLSVLYKAGILKRAQVVEMMNKSHITRADLAKFRDHCIGIPSGGVEMYRAEGCSAGET